MDTVVATPIVESAKTPIVEHKREYITPETIKEMPLEIYEKETGSKYINELFEVSDVLPDDVKTAVKSIDEYIGLSMSEKGYEPTTEAYRAALEGFKKELGIDENVGLITTIERLSKYIEAERIIRSLKTLDEEKILRQLKKKQNSSLMSLVLAQIERKVI